ncbi:putative membrane protein [Halorhabdus sp. SVX81]|uniref:DUF4129 domain-containing protein n=1 Tax=Halorhabdus sp. SVX81 TaxID=2978283 RepID=UPI0023DAEADE|nr:DUF4129 domain-containing protein [Halorhabdus sp. SVX81]WEL18705.1 putative membrane protein [Halorhabdus sp. SVX81]
MTDARRALFALGAVVCLIVVASALPAADPRLDPPGTDGGDVVAGQWDSGERNTTDPAAQPDDTSTEQQPSDDEADTERDIQVSGSPVPGTRLTVRTESPDPFETNTITVDGEVVGDIESFENLDVRVPYAEEMTIGIQGEETSRTVDIETNATIYEQSAAAPNGTLSITASVETEPVPGAVVTVDGERVGSTDSEGDATVPLPPSAGPVEIGVERGPVTAERVVDVPEPTVSFATPMLFPGFPAHVVVSADGAPVSDARVEISGESVATTGGDGRAMVWLPVDDSATVRATVGTESATTTVGNLYFRLAAVVVIVPGLVIGGVLTYLKLAALRQRRRAKGVVAVFVGLAGVLEGLSGAIGRLRRSLADWPKSVASIGRPSLSGLGGWRLPAIGTAISMPSLGGIAVSLPSFGSLRDAVSGSPNGSSTSRLGPNRLVEWLNGDDSEEADDVVEEPTDTDEPAVSLTPREEIRAAWHGFVDRLDLSRRETVTPGRVARRAIRDGFPADSVRRLLAIVREVEYGGREPSPDRVASARAAAGDLITFEDDEEDPPGAEDGSTGVSGE